MGPDRKIVVTPNYPIPTNFTRESLCELASEPYSFSRWWKIAADLASGFHEEDLEDLVAAFCHIDEGPSTMLEWNWAVRWQIACAMLVAQCNAEFDEKLDYLISIAIGPPDWSNGAAALAITECSPKRNAIRSAQRVMRT